MVDIVYRCTICSCYGINLCELCSIPVIPVVQCLGLVEYSSLSTVPVPPCSLPPERHLTCFCHNQTELWQLMVPKESSCSKGMYIYILIMDTLVAPILNNSESGACTVFWRAIIMDWRHNVFLVPHSKRVRYLSHRPFDFCSLPAAALVTYMAQRCVTDEKCMAQRITCKINRPL